MNRLTLFACVALVLMQWTMAAAEDFPKGLLGFIESNGYVGLTADKSTSGYSIQILTEEQYSVERDLPLLGQEELGRKYPIVAKEIASQLAERELERQKPRLDGTELGPTKLYVVGSAGELYRVVHVGDNYLLLQKNESKSSRFVLNTAAIASVRWYSAPSYHVENAVLRVTRADPGTNNALGARDWAKRQIDRYDRNQDGQLTADEWNAMIVNPERADADKNGIITVEEYSQFRTAR